MLITLFSKTSLEKAKAAAGEEGKLQVVPLYAAGGCLKKALAASGLYEWRPVCLYLDPCFMGGTVIMSKVFSPASWR
jgi:hypothetical protein